MDQKREYMGNNEWNRRKVVKTLGVASLVATGVTNGNLVYGFGAANRFKSSDKSKPVSVIVIGAGSRGWGAYSSYGLKFPEELKVVGVAEPVPYRRERISKAFNIPKENQFVTWEHVFDRPKFADALFITTPDDLHFGPAMAGLEAGYHLLLEKVIAQTWEECNHILELTEKRNAIVAVCHVLRYTSYFRKIKEVIDSGAIGDIVSIQHLEPVEHIHMSHSFVRGNWGNSKKSNPMILSKSCHDTDILRWIVDKPCKKVSSFGTLKYFSEKYAPSGSTARCTGGCAVERECIYSAKKIYLEKRSWLQHLNLETVTDETILRELDNGPYGRCVFRCDNDVVDHQISNFEFEDDITVSFSMEAMSNYAGRRTNIFGTRGDIIGDEKNLTITQFATGKQGKWDVSMAGSNSSGHGGGDHGLVSDFVKAVRENDSSILSSTIQVSMASHLMGFKAEESRLRNTVEQVNM
jgi:predicted dehydrogenase